MRLRRLSLRRSSVRVADQRKRPGGTVGEIAAAEVLQALPAAAPGRPPTNAVDPG